MSVNIRPHPITLPSTGATPKVRPALTDLQDQYNTGNKKPLEDLVRAWQGIKALDYKTLHSFFNIGGYHGEPFRGPGATSTEYWGGYCNHGNILFPVWHRVYVLAIEQALQSIPGCENVTLPYWDETSADSQKNGIPWILTNEFFTLDGKQIPNPLRSFVFPVDVKDQSGDDPNYSKPKGYETVRYPLSGLVGTKGDVQATQSHNSQYPDYATNVSLLDNNITFWLNSKEVVIDNTPIMPGLLSLYQQCLQAPNYTVFSNQTSSAAWNRGNNPDKKRPAVPIVALESPHNGMHLAVGGFDYPGAVLSPIRGANGDMGENNTAGLDPIFFFHHCFVDRVFWLWQKAHGFTDKLTVIAGYPGSSSSDAQGPTPGFQPDQTLTLDSPLYPFAKPDGSWFTGNDLADITKLGFDYGPGSLEPHALHANLAIALDKAAATTAQVVHVSGVNRSIIRGSFIITAHANINGKKELVGIEPFLSRWNVANCANCQTHLEAEAFISIPSTKHVAFSKITSFVEPSAIPVEINVITHSGILSLHSPLPTPFARNIEGQPFKVEVHTCS